MVAIVKFEREHIFEAVKLMYTQVANKPEKGFHFPVGRAACQFVGYPAAQLDQIIATATESFAGVGYPFQADVIRTGDTVLDIGAGAGTDAFIAALYTGDQGIVYGLDMTVAMHEKLIKNCEAAGVTQIRPLIGNAEDIPLDDATVDVVTSNGVLNLVPDKSTSFAEIYRVLKPGGSIQISDIVINKHYEDLDTSRANPQLWAECIVGALNEDHYLQVFADAGFKDLVVLDRVNYFAGSSSAPTRSTAEYFGARTVVLKGRKP